MFFIAEAMGDVVRISGSISSSRAFSSSASASVVRRGGERGEKVGTSKCGSVSVKM